MAGDDLAYRRRVAALPCCRCGAPPPSQAHHHTQHRGVGQRSSDLYAMPLCPPCHEALHGLTGPFRGYTLQRLRDWQSRMAALTADRLAGGR